MRQPQNLSAHARTTGGLDNSPNEEGRRRAEHQFAVFALACLAISAVAGFIAYWVDDYAPGTFVGFGLLLGIGGGTAIWGRRAGCFRRGAGTPVCPRYRQLAMVLGILMLVCGGALFVIAASAGRQTMVFDALNTCLGGVLFIYLSRKAAAVAGEDSVMPERGLTPHNLPDGSGPRS